MASTLVDLNDSREFGAGERVPYLYLSLEGDRPWAGGLRMSLHGIDRVSIGRGVERRSERTQVDGKSLLRVDVADDRMSREHLRLDKFGDAWLLVDLNSSNGSFIDGERVSNGPVTAESVIGVGRTIFLLREHAVPAEVSNKDLDYSDISKIDVGMRTLSPLLAIEFGRVMQFSSTEIDILVLGETGTGKELVARAVHKASGRSGDFVPVNCGALTDTLVESQLFGHQKGAFSGATENQPGLVRSADKGTLFLDEIGDLPMNSQAAFLRVLQERAVTPVGGTRAISFDAKLVAATHCPLEEMVESGDFRADLLARIRGFVLRLPPLSSRLEDMGGIISAVLHAKGRDQSTRISLSAATTIFRYKWPQNIRELSRTIDISSVLAGDGELKHEHLPEYLRDVPVIAAPRAASASEGSPVETGDVGRRERLIALLKRHEGNISAVARDMDKARNQIQRWIKRYDIDVSMYR
jgi:transcriptional regulator with GAF, ATPase, and Fis domain